MNNLQMNYLLLFLNLFMIYMNLKMFNMISESLVRNNGDYDSLNERLCNLKDELRQMKDKNK